MMSLEDKEPVCLIDADDVSLSFPVYSPNDRKLMTDPSKFLTDLYFKRTRRKKVPILKNLNFKLMAGDRIGLIGLNGAGKSTLLKLLASVYQPTTGSLTINGVTNGMFSLSYGMNKQATGLENIYLRGLQMGLSMSEIKGLLSDIVSFSELGDVLNHPYDTYSAGMQMRLAFSVSTMLDPDILLLDEWLGAGDKSFNEKVRVRMNELLKKSRGLVLASHNPGLLSKFCDRGLVMHEGEIVFDGPLDNANEFYKENYVVRKKPAR